MAFDSLPEGMSLEEHYIATYSDTKADVLEMRSDRKSWAAVPIIFRGEIQAVIFVDADVRDFFGEDDRHVARRLIQIVALGVSKYVQDVERAPSTGHAR